MRIKRNAGGTVTTAYEYGYGYDGGRRWRKDYLQNQWTWYPCGVACSAGELVEQQSDLTGATWTTGGQFLRVGARCDSLLLTRNSICHLTDIDENTVMMLDQNTASQYTALFDGFGALMASSGTQTTPCVIDENLLSLSPRDLIPSQQQPKPPCPCKCKGKNCKCPPSWHCRKNFKGITCKAAKTDPFPCGQIANGGNFGIDDCSSCNPVGGLNCKTVTAKAYAFVITSGKITCNITCVTATWLECECY